jgi:hypothetical protein
MPKQQQQPQYAGTFVLLRGPVAMGLLLLSVVVPLLQTTLHTSHQQQQQELWLLWTLVLRLGLLLPAAFGLAMYDGSRWLRHRVRSKLYQGMQQIVLDDLLTTIFHPQTGMIAVAVQLLLGNAAMYSILPTSREQRVLFVQSVIQQQQQGDESDDPYPEERKKQAREILVKPGGLVLLLPKAIQDWFKEQEDKDTQLLPVLDLVVAESEIRNNRRQQTRTALATDNSTTTTTHRLVRGHEEDDDDDDDEKHSTASSSSSSSSQELLYTNATSRKSVPARRVSLEKGATSSRLRRLLPPTNSISSSKHANNNNNNKTSSSTEPQQQQRSPTPLEIIGSLLNELTKTRLQRLLQQVGDTRTTTTTTSSSSSATMVPKMVGLVSAAALWLQFRYSRRARELFWTTLHASTTVALVSTTTMAATAFFLLSDDDDRTEHHPRTTTTPSDGVVGVQSSSALSSSRTRLLLLLSMASAVFSSSTMGGGLAKLIWSTLQASGLWAEGRAVRRRRWQGVLAALVLVYFGRRHRRALLESTARHCR